MCKNIVEWCRLIHSNEDGCCYMPLGKYKVDLKAVVATAHGVTVSHREGPLGGVSRYAENSLRMAVGHHDKAWLENQGKHR